MNDLISRQAALDMIDAIFPVDPTKSEYAQGIACGAALAKTYVEQLPSAQPEKMQLSKEDATKGATFDCISRQAVIDTLDVGAECLRRVLDETDIVGTEREKYKWGLGLFEACISDMKELPSAQPESRREWYMKGYRDAQRWIPVTEALPKEEDCPMDCLVTRKSKFIGNYTDMAVCEKNGTWTHEDWDAIVLGDVKDGKSTGLISTRDDNIIAWMPLPEPYKEGQND